MKKETLAKIIKGLKDLRYGIFPDIETVNNLLDELITLAESEDK